MLMSTLARLLGEKIASRGARTGVVGLGYVGLPLAVEFARSGFHTTGIDLDERKIESINAGRSYIPDVCAEDVARLRDAGLLDATSDFSIVCELDTINICVPTPLRKTKDPDMSYIVSAVESIARHIRPASSSCSIHYLSRDDRGSCAAAARGHRAAGGRDFFLAFSPSARSRQSDVQTRNVPKVVGGLTPDVHGLAAALFGTAIETVVPVSSTRVAEMVKLLENTFRTVNIGLVNELALMCDRMNINIWEVIAAASTKPFGFMPFYPGPGLGGHSSRSIPFYLSWKAKQTGFDPRFIELAGEVNAAMPGLVVEQVSDALNPGVRRLSLSMLVAGVAYKRDIDDIRESPALDVMGLLHDKGASVSYTDPHIPTVDARSWSGHRRPEQCAGQR